MTDAQPDTTTRLALASIPARHADPPPSIVSHIARGGAQLAYVGHADITLLLIEVDPLWNWEPLAYDQAGRPLIDHHGDRLVLWGRLTVHGKSIVCVGTCEARKGDPEKELIGDLLRNGAMRFGIGTRLWSKADSADPAGNGPSGYQKPSRTASSNDPARSSTPPSSAQLGKLKALGYGGPTPATMRDASRLIDTLNEANNAPE